MQTLIAGLSTASLLVATVAWAAPATYELDPDHTTVVFTVDHIGYAATLGIFGEVEGSFTYDTDTRALSDVAVTITASSVDTFHGRRDRHVKSKDFLNVRKFPKIIFTADSGTPKSRKRGTVTGNLTILGQTRPVRLGVTLNKAANYPFGHKRFTLGLSLSATIQRSEFGMTYGVANGLVGDDVDIRIETEAMRVK